MHELRVQLGDELDAKEERIRILEEQLVNTTGELEDVRRPLAKLAESVVMLGTGAQLV